MSTLTTIDDGLGDSLADLLRTLGRTDDALVAVGVDMEIIGWNRAATELLGYHPADAIGRPCHEILCWKNRCGDAVCFEDCPAPSLDDQDELVETRQVLGRSADGTTLWLSASTIVPVGDLRHQCRLVHLIREVALPPELERLLVERVGAWTPGTAVAPPRRPDPLVVLTAREREVLDLLTEGLDGAAIARELFLSPATVRNHVQHILKKLGVHSRLEAVALVLRGR